MFRLKLAVVLAAHLLIVLGLAGAVLWGSGEGNHYVDRLRLAHGNLKEYLALMQQTQQHFQKLRDQVVYGQAAEEFDAVASRQELDATLQMLLTDTQREVDLVEREDARKTLGDAFEVEERRGPGLRRPAAPVGLVHQVSRPTNLN